MSDDVNYQTNWSDEATQCKNCKLFASENGKSACVPPDKTFEAALKEFGECSPDSHCNLFAAK